MSYDFELTGHVALITGSTSGIGRALAEALAAQGVHIVLNGLGATSEIETARFEIAAKHNVKVLYHGANMLAPAEVADMVCYAEREFGRLDILVNNAGIQHVAPIADFPQADWDRIIAINLSATFHAIKAAIPIMTRQGRGRIVNIASAHALVASPFKSAYVAAKHGIMGLTKTAALELATQGITCNAICPGFVKTPLVDGQIRDQALARHMSEEQVLREVILEAQPTKKFVEYDQIAGILLYLVSNAGASANGAAYQVDGGWVAH